VRASLTSRGSLSVGHQRDFKFNQYTVAIVDFKLNQYTMATLGEEEVRSFWPSQFLRHSLGI
jgi:hypothetical protein